MDIKQIEVHVSIGNGERDISDITVLNSRLAEIKTLYSTFDTIVVVIHGLESNQKISLIQEGFAPYKGEFLIGWSHPYEWLRDEEIRTTIQDLNILSLLGCPTDEEGQKDFFSLLKLYTPKLRVIMLDFVRSLPKLDYLFGEMDSLVEKPQFIRFKYDHGYEDFDESLYQEFITSRLGDYSIFEDGTAVSYYGDGAWIKNIESPKISLFRLKSGRYGANTNLNNQGYQYVHDISRLVESDNLRKTEGTKNADVRLMARDFDDLSVEYVLTGSMCNDCHMRPYCSFSDNENASEITLPDGLCKILRALSRPFFQVLDFQDYRLPEDKKGFVLQSSFDEAGSIKSFIERNRECFPDYEMMLLGDSLVDITFEKNPTTLMLPPTMTIDSFIEALEEKGKDTTGLPEIADLIHSGKIMVYLNYLGFLDGRWRIFFFRLRETKLPGRVNAYPGSKREY